MGCMLLTQNGKATKKRAQKELSLTTTYSIHFFFLDKEAKRDYK